MNGKARVSREPLRLATDWATVPTSPRRRRQRSHATQRPSSARNGRTRATAVATATIGLVLRDAGAHVVAREPTCRGAQRTREFRSIYRNAYCVCNAHQRRDVVAFAAGVRVPGLPLSRPKRAVGADGVWAGAAAVSWRAGGGLLCKTLRPARSGGRMLRWGGGAREGGRMTVADDAAAVRGLTAEPHRLLVA